MKTRLVGLGAVIALWAGALSAQPVETLRLVGPGGGSAATVTVERHRGYGAVPFRTLEGLGWEVALNADGGEARRAPDAVFVRARTPFFAWNDQILQLTYEAYWVGDELWVPLQLISDFLPAHQPEHYAFETNPLVLRARTTSAWTGPANRAEPAPEVATSPRSAAAPRERSEPIRRVVVIDPGHGGADPGARGPGGTREKDVVLALALALALELESRPDLDVRLTRVTDRLVPPWERGEWATGVRGERPAIFISIHANSGDALSARGFETYFLSEARTEHERRVAALENASFSAAGDAPAQSDSELGFILKDLGNLDHQHWSELLAGLIQERIGPVHAGPNRGVKQAPLAVLTNTLMPAVLLEVGFISNRAEERLLASRGFQTDAAIAIAAAVDEFFTRYPPGAVAAETAGGAW